MSDIAIKVEGLGKRYRIGARQEKYKTLRDTLTSGALRPFRALRSLSSHNGHNRQSAIANRQSEIIWALKDISFEVKRGEVVGIIGRNGAGKSTLLKILSRITEPTEGYADIRGRIASLLEVGTGFHPELTGRENIYLNGAILGMKRLEIQSKFDEIVSFAEVEKFIDSPVKHYSSGMYLRLAFAVAAHLEPEILVIDEVLAVGDADFQKKCLGKMSEVSKQGRTVLFVSHNMGAVKGLCSAAILLRDGSISFRGPAEEAISHYLSKERVDGDNLAEIQNRGGDGPIRLTHIEVLDHLGRKSEAVQSGQEMTIELTYSSGDSCDTRLILFFHIFVATVTGEPLFLCSTKYGANAPRTMASTGTIRCCIPKVPLIPGRYILDVVCKGSADRVLMDHISGAKTLIVVAGRFFDGNKLPPAYAGPFLVDHSWETDEHQSDPDDIEKIPISI